MSQEEREALTDEDRRDIADAMPKVGEPESAWVMLRGYTLRRLVAALSPAGAVQPPAPEPLMAAANAISGLLILYMDAARQPDDHHESRAAWRRWKAWALHVAESMPDDGETFIQSIDKAIGALTPPSTVQRSIGDTK